MRPGLALLVAMLLTVGGLAVLVLLIPAAPMTGDGQYYIQFVRNGLQHGASSWHERRLLGPLIVRALPMDAQPGFFVLTSVSLGVTAVLTWAAARELVHNEARALVAIPLLFGTWVVAPNLREYGLVDPLAWAFVAGVWWATVRRQWYVAAVVAAVGVVAKEIVVLAAVAAAAAAFDRQKPWQTAVVAGPALLVALGLTVFFPGSGSDGVAYVFKWVRDGLFSNGVARAGFLLFASYAALWLLIPLGWSSLPGYLQRAGAVFLAAAVALPLVGSPERMEEAIFPLVITCALLATRTWDPRLVWLLALACVVFVARIGGDARIPTPVAWAGLAVALALIAWCYATVLGFRRAPAPAPAAGPPGTTVPSP
ncbi:MAG: hypothetical protein JO020_08455 [Chloroflexi bacterium]|nr:hypothetical protein [Chloroflexota bacterium]